MGTGLRERGQGLLANCVKMPHYIHVSTEISCLRQKHKYEVTRYSNSQQTYTHQGLRVLLYRSNKG